MKKVNEVFFGEHGLTSTSANHLANIAQEKMEEQIFLDLINQSMQASVRQVRLSLGRPSSQATREEALQQVAMLKAAKEAQQTGR